MNAPNNPTNTYIRVLYMRRNSPVFYYPASKSKKVMLKDIIFVLMRNKTRYPKIEALPSEALTVSQFARKYKFSNPTYVHTKYVRYIFGYKTSSGQKSTAPYPGYDIYDFKGNCYVLVKDEDLIKKS